MLNNPVQKNIDMLARQWQELHLKPDCNVICISYQEKESNMIDAFMKYILAIESEFENFVWVFESEFIDHKTYVNDVLVEMEEQINDWNSTTKPVQYDDGIIDWKPDYTLVDDKNPISILVENLNNFASYIFPDKKNKVSYVFKAYSISKTQAAEWFKYALSLDFEKHVVWTVAQSSQYKTYDKVLDYHKSVSVLEPKIDVNGMVEQLAQQADQTVAENKYRVELIKLMHAVENRDSKKVKFQAKLCLDIILKQLKVDFNWISQIITVYIILYNDQIGYKDYNEALYFATKAVDAAEIAKTTIEPSLSYRLAAQTYLGRGSIFVLKDDWKKAHNDYLQAKNDYEYCNDYLMMAEACRLCGWSKNKFEKFENTLPFYEEGFYLYEKIDPTMIVNSSYPLMLKEVINDSKFVKMITQSKLDKVLIPLFGVEYVNIISSYGEL
jgi:hypothetical protein